MSTSWTEKLRKQIDTGESGCDSMFDGLLTHIEPIGIQPRMVGRKVCVIGIGGGFPERTLVCSPPDYLKLRNNLSVTCCDADPCSDPETTVDSPYQDITLQIPTVFKSGYFYYSCTSSYDLFNELPPECEFDSVLFFRAVDTGRQILQNGLIESIAPRLKKGGYLICSGGRFPNKVTPEMFAPLKLVKLARLPDWSDGYPFTNNNGVVLRKVS